MVILLGNHAISLLSLMESGTLIAQWMAGRMDGCGAPQKKISTRMESGASAPQTVRQHSSLFTIHYTEISTT